MIITLYHYLCVNSVTNQTMKKLLIYAFIGILSCSSAHLLAQSTENSLDKPVYSYEQMPQFPGGDEALLKFIKDNLRYPQASFEAGTEGRVTIRFVITKEGAVTDVVVIRSLDSLCDQEAMRVVKMMPTWIPGRQLGKMVPVYYTLPVVYKLERGSIEEKTKLDSAILAGRPVYSVEVMPHFPGGEKAMLKFIEKNLRYPEVDAKNGRQGLTFIRFIVTQTGEITDVKILRSLSPGCDAEAVRVVKMMPKWKPGTHKGKPANVYYTLPFAFKLQS